MTLLDDLYRETEDFFDDRTVGFDPTVYENGFHWRGPGSDEDWAEMTREEIGKLLSLLTAIREMQRRKR